MSDADINASPNNYFTVFQRAFEIQDMPTMGGFEHPQLRHRYLPAILLYNAGLTVHRLALCSGSTGAYLRALELYQHGQAFLDQHHHKTDMNNAGGVGDATTIASPNGDGNDINNNEEECECRSLVLLRLALANNLGHCYSHLNHGTETRECLSFVATLFLSQFPTASSSSSVYSLASSSSSSFVCSTPQQQQQQQQQLCYGFGPRWSPEEYEFFHLSLYFALDRRLIWAPAA